MARRAVQAKLRSDAANARYDAAGNGRRFAGWNAPSSGPNTAITGLQKIRDRSRDATRNEWSAAANVRAWTSNVIGTGIVPRFKTKNEGLKQRLTEAYGAWVPDADADCVLDFYGLQALAARSWFSSGEVFVRERPRRQDDGLNVPFQIQVLEADMCPLLDTDVLVGMPEGNRIRQGIEFNKIGRRVAYWFYREHPGEKSTSFDASTLVRVPADSVCHVYEPTRPGALRGVPEMASVLAKLKAVADFDDALVERQRLANLFAMFVTRPLPSGANDPMTGLPGSGTDDAPVLALEPGISQELLPGEDVKFSAPPDAGANYSDFMRSQFLAVAAASGTPYELLSGDLKDVSDRTLRIIINEFRRLCEQRQWLVFIPQMCAKVMRMWIKHATLGGVIRANEAVEAAKVRWSPQGWAYIHPVQDVQAKKLEVEAGFRSRSSVILGNGDDPETVDVESGEDAVRRASVMPEPPKTNGNSPANNGGKGAQ